MLDCPPWTLTQSSGTPALELVPPLGLETTKADRDAAVPLAEAEVWDDDAELVAGELVCAADPVDADDADPVGVELPAGVVLDAAAVEDTPVEGEPVGDGVVVGVGDDVGEGVGDGVAVGDGEAGSAWQTGVAAAAAFACGSSGAACALLSAPAVRKPPLSSVTAATRAYPKRIRIACPR